MQKSYEKAGGKEESRISPRFLGLSIWQSQLPFTKLGKNAGGTDVEKENQKIIFGH